MLKGWLSFSGCRRICASPISKRFNPRLWRFPSMENYLYADRLSAIRLLVLSARSKLLVVLRPSEPDADPGSGSFARLPRPMIPRLEKNCWLCIRPFHRLTGLWSSTPFSPASRSNHSFWMPWNHPPLPLHAVSLTQRKRLTGNSELKARAAKLFESAENSDRMKGLPRIQKSPRSACESLRRASGFPKGSALPATSWVIPGTQSAPICRASETSRPTPCFCISSFPTARSIQAMLFIRPRPRMASHLRRDSRRGELGLGDLGLALGPTQDHPAIKLEELARNASLLDARRARANHVTPRTGQPARSDPKVRQKADIARFSTSQS